MARRRTRSRYPQRPNDRPPLALLIPALGFFWAGVVVVVLAVLGTLSSPRHLPVAPPPRPLPSFSFSPLPALPQTVCRDGWVSSSHGRGTCSHHGGEAGLRRR